jgi:hypothetical protein
MRLISWLLLNLLFAAAAFSQTDPATLPQVEFFSPQGTVKGVRQVAACFSDPMVTFGDPRLPEPRASLPVEGESSIDENQVFILALDTDCLRKGSINQYSRTPPCSYS